jgi:hypothetical protein
MLILISFRATRTGATFEGDCSQSRAGNGSDFGLRIADCGFESGDGISNPKSAIRN